MEVMLYLSNPIGNVSISLLYKAKRWDADTSSEHGAYGITRMVLLENAGYYGAEIHNAHRNSSQCAHGACSVCLVLFLFVLFGGFGELVFTG
jgi:hypothetical protein